MEGEQPLGHRPRQGSPCREAVGGGDLAAQFAEAGLLDQLMVSIAPVTLGAGRPLFPRRFDLELTDVARNRAFVCATYRVVGPMAPSGGGPTS